MMKEIITKARENSKKRNFNQSFDLIINLKDVDNIDFFIEMKHPVKENKICALVGSELYDDAKKYCHEAIHSDDFAKQDVKKLAKEYDLFIGQANIMPLIASTFGRVLGRLGKMPSPKAGSIVPPNANLKNVVERLSKTLRIRTAGGSVIRTIVGKEDMDDSKIEENINWILDQLMHHLPNGKENIKSIILKTTMGKGVKWQI